MALREDWADSIVVPFAQAAIPALPVITPVPSVGAPPTSGWRGKRALDLAFSAVLLVLLAPLMVVAALAVKLSSKGPVFFRQSRIGLGGKEFHILKFRTMCSDAEERLLTDRHLHGMYLDGGHKIPCRLDPRVTRVGRIFRTWSIDEMPQLLNVLLGHMSLVGPRPVVHGELGRYGEHLGAYLALRPGLTGVWQTSGRNQIVFPARAELDAWYHVRCSPWVDLKILLKTPLSVLRRQGSE